MSRPTRKRLRMSGRLVCLGLMIMAALCQSRPVLAQPNPFAETFVKHIENQGIEITVEGLRELLRVSAPTEESEQRLDEALKNLGSDDYAVRNAATTLLMNSRSDTLPRVKPLVSSTDPEVSWRATLIVNALSSTDKDLVYASLVVVDSRGFKGLVRETLGVAPLCKSESNQLAFTKALVATATPEDRELLTASLKHSLPMVRWSSLAALLKLFEADAVQDVVGLLNDPDDLVRFSAATRLLQFRRQESLKTLGQLLESEQLVIRNRSIHALRSVIGQPIPYSAYEPQADREAHARQWQEAIARLGHGQPGEMTARPDSSPASTIRFVLHQTGKKKSILVLNDDSLIPGPEVSVTAGLNITPSGTLLIADPIEKRVEERNSRGEVLWKSPILKESPQQALRQSDGLTLIVTREGTGITMNQNGDIIRKESVGHLRDVKLVGKNQLAFLYQTPSKVVVVESNTLKPVWGSEEIPNARNLCVLADGKLLVTVKGDHQLVELGQETPAVRIVTPITDPWQVGQPGDGNLIVQDETGLHLLNRQGASISTLSEPVQKADAPAASPATGVK